MTNTLLETANLLWCTDCLIAQSYVFLVINLLNYKVRKRNLKHNYLAIDTIVFMMLNPVLELVS